MKRYVLLDDDPLQALQVRHGHKHWSHMEEHPSSYTITMVLTLTEITHNTLYM